MRSSSKVCAIILFEKVQLTPMASILMPGSCDKAKNAPEEVPMAPYRLLKVLGSSRRDCSPPEMPGKKPVQWGLGLITSIRQLRVQPPTIPLRRLCFERACARRSQHAQMQDLCLCMRHSVFGLDSICTLEALLPSLISHTTLEARSQGRRADL